MRRFKKGMWWAAVLAGLLFVLVIAALFSASRFIRLESVQNKIQTTVSKEIGGQVTFDRLDLTLFPLLGIEIHQPSLLLPEVTSGTASAIRAYPSFWPLFLGRIELARIQLDRPDLTVFLADPAAEPEKKPLSSPVRTLDETVAYIFSLVSAEAPGLRVSVKGGRLVLVRSTKAVFSLSEMDIRIRIPTVAASETASLQDFRVVAEADRMAINWDGLPAPLKLRVKTIELRRGVLSFSEGSAGLLDGSVRLSGSFHGSLQAFHEADLIGQGVFGKEIVRWLQKIASIPQSHGLRTPLTIEETRFRWQKKKTMELTGSLKIEDGPALSFEATRTPDRIAVRKLMIQDRESKAELSLGFEKRSLDLHLNGSLTRNTLNRMFEADRKNAGFLRGDFRAHVELDRPGRSTMTGELRGENNFLPNAFIPVVIDRFSLKGDQNRLTVEGADFNVAENRFSLKGDVRATDDGFMVDADLTSDGIDWGKILAAIVPKEKDAAPERPQAETKPRLPVRGTLRVQSKQVVYDRFTVSPVKAEISFGPDLTRVAVSQAVLCGLNFPGNLDLRPEDFSLDLRPGAQGQDLESTLTCLSGNDLKLTGRFNLTTDFRTSGSRKDPTVDRLLEAGQGKIAFKAEDGRIHRFPMLARVFGFLNLTGIFLGQIPDMGKGGLAYDKIKAEGDLGGGKFKLTQFVLNGPSVNLAAEGDYRFASKKVDVMILVAPLKTIDTVVKKIPLLRDVTGGTIIAIPVQVKGPINDPTVKTLPTKSIGKGLAGLLKRTVTLPSKIVEPFEPKAGEKEPPK